MKMVTIQHLQKKKTTDTTENIITEEKPEPAVPTKDTTVTTSQKSKVQTTIDITDSQEVYSYEQNSKIDLKDFTATLTDYTDTKLTNYRLAANSKLSTAQTGIQEVTLLGDSEERQNNSSQTQLLSQKKKRPN